jgi:hypothetical protein
MTNAQTVMPGQAIAMTPTTRLVGARWLYPNDGYRAAVWVAHALALALAPTVPGDPVGRPRTRQLLPGG